MGIAHLLVMALEKEGVPKAEATRKIWMVDSRGLIVKVLSVCRPGGSLSPAAVGTGLEMTPRGQPAQNKEPKEGTTLISRARDSSQSSLDCSCPKALNTPAHVCTCAPARLISHPHQPQSITVVRE